jgi:hypothetical protein
MGLLASQKCDRLHRKKLYIWANWHFVSDTLGITVLKEGGLAAVGRESLGEPSCSEGSCDQSQMSQEQFFEGKK